MNVSVYRQAAYIALAAAAGAIIASAVILLVQGDGNAPIQIISSPSGVDPSTGGSSAPAPKLPPEDIQVYISGAVRDPGVYPLQSGDRLVDALEAAGGTIEGADLDRVNLALRVLDEGYYYISKEGETPPLAATDTSAPAPGALQGNQTDGGLVNLNTASADVLSTLPGIGPVKAQAIVSYRQQNGPFASIKEITAVDRIGSGTYEKIRDLVSVGSP